MESARISSASLATLAVSDNPNIRRNATHIFLKRFVADRRALETLFRHLHDPALRSTPDGERARLAQDLLYDNDYRLGWYSYEREDGSADGDWQPYIDEPDGSRHLMSVRGFDPGPIISPEGVDLRAQAQMGRIRPAEGRPEEVERRRRRREAVVVREEGEEGPLSQRDIFVRRRTEDLGGGGASAAGEREGSGGDETDVSLPETVESDVERVEILEEQEEIVDDEPDEALTSLLGRLQNLTNRFRSRQNLEPEE